MDAGPQIKVSPQVTVTRPAERYSVRDVAIEQIARLLCRADGVDPDSDWRVSGCVMLAVHVEPPEDRAWTRYRGKAEKLLRQAFGEDRKE